MSESQLFVTPVGGAEDTGGAKGYGLAMLVHILGGADPAGPVVGRGLHLRVDPGSGNGPGYGRCDRVLCGSGIGPDHRCEWLYDHHRLPHRGCRAPVGLAPGASGKLPRRVRW